ncbi:hypothetical protein [Paenibacillus sp.]|uniref:hypothetical protein n=1 Tax=Paenibacillus sp. TaxID=58172 RepID=UPI00281261A7|nr:hypothetical protein [Paenibacillus sp.]
MAVNSLLVRSYATNIYLTGTTSIEGIIASGRQEYETPVMQHAADKFSRDDIERTAASGWISPERAEATSALKDSEDPQYRSITLSA